ncbi:hypothetical protein C2E23DRAFT_859678 [Lenzites betulinus]|nr:hypothetical protein C2E23DRAFT_859678 [Lenzites betulinus]
MPHPIFPVYRLLRRICTLYQPRSRCSSEGGSSTDNYRDLWREDLRDEEHAVEDQVALQKHFKHRRHRMLEQLSLKSNCPRHPALNNGLTFFEEPLEEKAIVIPGIFFDINPAHRRNVFPSPCHHFVRLSFGPLPKVLEKGKEEGDSAPRHSYRTSIDSSATCFRPALWEPSEIQEKIVRPPSGYWTG